jgi:hypothetical protein
MDHIARTELIDRGLGLSFRFATEEDIPALVKLRLAIDTDHERRFGRNRYATTISERSVARGLKSSRVVVALQHGRIIGALEIFHARNEGCVSPRRQCRPDVAALGYWPSAH